MAYAKIFRWKLSKNHPCPKVTFMWESSRGQKGTYGYVPPESRNAEQTCVLGGYLWKRYSSENICANLLVELNAPQEKRSALESDIFTILFIWTFVLHYTSVVNTACLISFKATFNFLLYFCLVYFDNQEFSFQQIQTWFCQTQSWIQWSLEGLAIESCYLLEYTETTSGGDFLC